ncbi:MAG: hypothetical protein UX08_C0012G0004 [Candidatus Collierbacteria bacterium GW2011_GWB1_45_35]|uniref:Uncharacterized protein n=1 Tax=Candidatus Collierbacteria bacterium GW2011_GWB2_45_17 TaxID=1618388 RepID=A0A837IMD9_9BACT|nr:MAG: hypothetical protein UW48_C0001G0111 [Microgenomates group bacterium GW2011_GWC1_44_23]KKT96231.1 MAG: hypothetical protein UW96_C0001G0109 [Candidatus Collierbacteria bacterium GW2011_GWA1_45_15]KKU01271.1 MAG: hypothetical protein UX01_C0001G0115 [Candidatus Collierbacteria bacterium GW2011_GWB2_45_17]KKU04971.1 MAG: hypothetical protein UX08_C0012G0004 [Candidatus Collierbacteria bacterium GW2011_GWB1_45_35]KKU06925.1 MAG: hypothetical protein UX11_C0023G0006 [Candidatus Collierbacte
MAISNLSRSIQRLEKRSGILRNRLLFHKAAKKFFSKSSLIAYDLRQRSSHLLAGAGLIGALITMPAPSGLVRPATSTHSSQPLENELTVRQKLMSSLQEILPHQPTWLTPETAQKIEQIIYENTNISTKAVLEDQTLKHQLGYIGFEQHLSRFPGDSLAEHDDVQEAGLAPGRGAFGYFAKDRGVFTTREFMREKYYCVVQTLYLDNWNQDHRFLKDWYAFRKMIVINPVNGLAVVCDIGDAGPADWTGKQFGGSPEIMQILDLNKGPRKGLVLMLFVDDPDNTIPLGPIN